MENERRNDLDTLKLFAFLCVFTGHFIGLTSPGLFQTLMSSPWYYAVGGLSGKFGVALLAVISSFVTWNSASAMPSGLVSADRYIIRRYLYFLICGLIVNAGFFFLDILHITPATHPWSDFLRVTALLGGEYFSPFWCMPSFLMISILSYLNGRCRVSFAGIAVEIGLCLVLSGWLLFWVAIGLMGSLAAALIAWEPFSSTMRKVPYVPTVCMLVTAFVIIKRPESYPTCFLDGVASVLMLLALEYSRYLKRIVGWRYAAFCGRHSMELYMLHLIMIYVSMHVLRIPPVAVYLIDFVLLVALSVPLHRLIRFLTGIIPSGFRRQGDGSVV